MSYHSAGEVSAPTPKTQNGNINQCPLSRRRGKHPPTLRLIDDAESDLSEESPSSIGSRKTFVDSPHPLDTEAYEVIREIGHDSEGPCTLVSRHSDRQLRVIKSVRQPSVAHGKPIEATILQDIFPERHNNIIQLHTCDYIEQIGLVQYYLEYCSGGDLHDLCRQYDVHDAWFPELFIWKTFLELTEALEFLHRGFDPRLNDRPGIVHRDIKPANIFLRRSPNSMAYPDAVLADFGSASFAFATYEPAGTFRWQPPEIPRKTPKGDVWSLGAVIHQMVHFEPPVLALPVGVEPTDANIDNWYLRPEARLPIMSIPEVYSQELIDMMFVALERDYNKRASSSRLMKVIRQAVEEQYPPNADWITNPQPLQPWAFDHLTTARLSPEDSVSTESYSYGRGQKQYFEMMKRFEPASRESSETLTDELL